MIFLKCVKMKSLFLWKICNEIEDKFAGPCLFLALYRLYKNPYFGKGFKLIGKINQDLELKERIEQLPIDIKGLF